MPPTATVAPDRTSPLKAYCGEATPDGRTLLTTGGPATELIGADDRVCADARIAALRIAHSATASSASGGSPTEDASNEGDRSQNRRSVSSVDPPRKGGELLTRKACNMNHLREDKNHPIDIDDCYGSRALPVRDRIVFTHQKVFSWPSFSSADVVPPEPGECPEHDQRNPRRQRGRDRS